MRRPVMYLAGLLLATGASLALAGPASAASSHDHPGKCHHHGAQFGDWDDDDYGYYYNHTDSHDVKWSLLSGIGILGIGSNS